MTFSLSMTKRVSTAPACAGVTVILMVLNAENVDLAERSFLPANIAVITISDTRTLADDKSGHTLVERITAAGHVLADRLIVKDDVRQIRAAVRKLVKRRDVDVVITTGGTGLTGRDVTIEALRPLFDKEIEGFGVVFHMISYAKIKTSTMQSRATAGVVAGTYVFCLPGSPGACRDGWDEILLHQLDYRHHPCNFIEIMPRLDEHLRRTGK
jgi:molybdopterin adenylyltransferase